MSPRCFFFYGGGEGERRETSEFFLFFRVSTENKKIVELKSRCRKANEASTIQRKTLTVFSEAPPPFATSSLTRSRMLLGMVSEAVAGFAKWK